MADKNTRSSAEKNPKKEKSESGKKPSELKAKKAELKKASDLKAKSEPVKKPEQKAVAKAEGKKASEQKAKLDPVKKPSSKKPEQKAVAKAEGKKASEQKAKSEPVKKPSSKKPEQKAVAKAEVKKPSEPTAKKDPVKKPSEQKAKEEIKLNGLYAFKLAMSSLYTEKGQVVPVTFLKFKPWLVSQIKRKEKEGYNSVQLACVPAKNKTCSKAVKNHLSPAGLSGKSLFIREIRQKSVDNIKVGQALSIHSLQKGDRVKLQAVSKGHGFTGVVKRWGFKGGPASHGSKTHRTGGSIGNRTEPARVMPGKKMAGRYGVEKTSLKNVQVIDVISSENMIVVKGPVPGAGNGLVLLSKMEKR